MIYERGRNPEALPRPLWADDEGDVRDLTIPVLGPARSRWLYPIGSVTKTGAKLACGSDWSVTSLNPLEGMQIAVTRRGLDEGPGPGWIPEEMIDLKTAIECYTINGAYMDFLEKETGSLEVGKAADLVVLSANLFEVPAHEMHEARALLTLLEGQEVFRDESFP